MSTFAPHFIVLALFLAALCGPGGTPAQAPVASNHSLTTVSVGSQVVY